jgi:hypothetical protein
MTGTRAGFARIMRDLDRLSFRTAGGHMSRHS